MAVYVDNARIAWRGRLWCHLVADSLSELHEFAEILGLRRAWFQTSASYPHYDVTVETRKQALGIGAISGGRRQIIACARRLKEELSAQEVGYLEQLQLFSK